MLVVVYRNG